MSEHTVPDPDEAHHTDDVDVTDVRTYELMNQASHVSVRGHVNHTICNCNGNGEPEWRPRTYSDPAPIWKRKFPVHAYARRSLLPVRDEVRTRN